MRVTMRKVHTQGVSVGKALAAPWVARRNRTLGGTLSYQESVGADVGIILFLALVEIVAVDLLIDTLWGRIAAAAVGVIVAYLLVGFSMALHVYPHRVEPGILRLRYGATFAADIDASLIKEVCSERKGSDQRHTAGVIGDALTVPVMGATNVLVRLKSPVQVELRKEVSTVQEVRLFAVKPAEAVQLVRGAMDGTASETRTDAQPVAKPPVPLWLRRLRWAGLLILLAEIVLVVTGFLDWRIAASILAVTEGTILVLGGIESVAFLSQYRKLRRSGIGRSEAFSQAFSAVMPPPMAELIRQELGLLRVLALAVTRRTERSQPGDVPLPYGRTRRRTLAAVAALLAATGVFVLATVPDAVLRYVAAAALLYGAFLTTVMAMASSTRPHVRQGGELRLRWGTHHELVVPVELLREVQAQRSPPRHDRGTNPDVFHIPCQGRGTLILHLVEKVDVPTRLGAQRPVTTIVTPVDDATAGREAIVPYTDDKHIERDTDTDH